MNLGAGKSMKQVANQVSSIEVKIKKLGEQQEKMKELIGRQETEIAQLNSRVDEQKNEIKSLEERIKRIKIAKTAETKEGVADAKMKINELVREIDKCIGLLNT